MEYTLLKNFLDRTAYFYYARGLHESDPMYLNTIEYENFINLHSKWNNQNKEFQLVLRELRCKFDDNIVIENGTSNKTPCYEIEICFENSNSRKKVITIYISLFIPFYHIVSLFKVKNNLTKYDFNINNDIEVIISVILKRIGYSKFPHEIINHKIPDLFLTEDFDYKSAFFTDYYRFASPKNLNK